MPFERPDGETTLANFKKHAWPLLFAGGLFAGFAAPYAALMDPTSILAGAAFLSMGFAVLFLVLDSRPKRALDRAVAWGVGALAIAVILGGGAILTYGFKISYQSVAARRPTCDTLRAQMLTATKAKTFDEAEAVATVFTALQCSPVGRGP